MQTAHRTTETKIDITNYLSERDAGLVAVTKPVKTSGNYVFMRTTHALGVVNGSVAAIEGDPELKNINRQSVADFQKMIDADEAELARLREQVAALIADMDALDAA